MYCGGYCALLYLGKEEFHILLRLYCVSIAPSKGKFFSEGMFLYRGFSLLQSEHPLLLHFTGLTFETFFVKVEAS